MNDIAQAIAAAEQLRVSYEAAHPEQSDPLAAMPIDSLVAWKGVAVERFNPVDAPPGTLGWLEPGEDLIWLSVSLDEPVRRFTLAHELGHWALHRRVGGQADVVSGGLPLVGSDQQGACTAEDIEAYLAGGLAEDELLQPGQSYSPRARRERAADAFAAALLAPLERVRLLFLGTPEREPLDPERLAAHFGMTLQALLGRLAEMLREQPNLREPAMPQARPARRAKTQPTSAPGTYDPWQQAAIAAATPALVVAGPGSGKTSTLVGRVRHVVEEQGVAPDRILALTFSNKAALEMRERIAALLGAESVLPTVSTFHSFCADLLRLYGPQVGLRPDFALLDLPGSYFLLRKVAGRLPLRHYGHLSNPELHFATLLGAISRAKDELATPEDYLRLAEAALVGAQSDEERLKAERAREVALVYQVYQQALAAQGNADFGDLILLAVQFLKATPAALAELHGRYQHILVDEFQDINRASGVLLKLLAGERANIWVVGDQDQAIYRFRGASPANIGQFHRDYPGAQVLPLSRNYRSLADIVAAAGAFREAALRLSVSSQPGAPSEDQKEAPERTSQEAPSEQSAASESQEAVRLAPEEPIITLAAAPDAQGEIAGLVSAIEERHARGVPYRDQVVLCRTREQARMVIEGLERVGMPASAGGSLLEQPDVKDLLAIVALLAEPSGMGLLRAAAQPDHFIPRDDLLALFAHAQREGIPAGVLLWQPERLPTLSPQGFVGAMRLADILADLRATPDLWTLLAHYVFIHTALARRLLQANDQASRQPARPHLDHLRGVLDLARRFDTQEREREAEEDQGAAADPGKRWERFLEYLRVLIELRADDGGRREPEDGDGEAADIVRVMTVHASKGLEFPVVYLPQLAQQRFPVSMRSEAAPMPPGLCEDETIRSRHDARVAHLLDEASLFYVGLTRARDELLLSYAERYKKRRAAASDFLRHIEEAPGARLRRVRWGEADLAALEGKASEAQSAADGLALEKEPGARPAAISAGELETYLRCPRQYQYRYVYGFQPAGQGYRQFYECVQRTLRVLHERLAAAGAASGLASQPEENASASAEPAFSLEAAQELFAENWRQFGPLEHPFAENYFAHGLRVIERTWRGLTGAAESQAQEAATDRADDEARPTAKLAASSRLSQRLDARLDGQAIQVTVDRVEEEGLPLAVDPERPVRLVRHRMSGKDEEKADVEVRHVLYALAQEQRTPGRPVEVYEHNLSTGALVPVPLDSRAAQNRRADLAAALVGMRARRYPPKPDRRLCPRCPFLMICPAE
ncbi:MAG TPA: ATP-dependent helicase [Ktedonobacterales bacterium]|jgi:superfamily I DNA/RNA helicase